MIKWLPEEARTRAMGVLQLKKSQHPLISHDPWLDSWLVEERDRISQLMEQLPKAPEKSWDMLNKFFLSELERV